jgi:glycosyltransferase involved in cell wall biosynthesis
MGRRLYDKARQHVRQLPSLKVFPRSAVARERVREAGTVLPPVATSAVSLRSRTLNLPVRSGLDGGEPRYRFGFVLNTTIGNLTRFDNLRKYAARDADVTCSWTPVTHLLSVGAASALRGLPWALAMRLWVLRQMWPALRTLAHQDVVMLHLFEAEIACVARSYLARRPALVSSTDEAPIVDPDSYPVYPNQKSKPPWRRSFRLWLDRWRASRIDAFIPFTAWGGRILEDSCNVPPEQIFPIHVGLDLEVWMARGPARKASDELPRLLFVGTDFDRKGGGLLLRVFEQHFADSAELHIVSSQAPEDLPRHVHVHRDLQPNDARLIALYASCDLLVLPTNADLVPWTVLEAMAMQLPVVSTDVGAIPEIVVHDVTGFVVPAGDAEALAKAIASLLSDPDLRRAMGQRGRERIENDFDAAVNVPRILAVMKSLADRRRRG